MEIRTQSLVVRTVRSGNEVTDIQRFRADGFGGPTDADGFDMRCTHIVVTRSDEQHLLGCLRVLGFQNGQEVQRGYSSQFYDLHGLSDFGQPFLELGRFFVLSGPQAADVIRLIWAMVAKLVDRQHAAMLIGCTSFSGTDPMPYHSIFATLSARHLGPKRWRPGIISPEFVAFESIKADQKAGINHAQMPTLLRSYLSMGGWVSDHAVIDHALSTIHVFTALEVEKIPLHRAARLRQLAA